MENILFHRFLKVLHFQYETIYVLLESNSEIPNILRKLDNSVIFDDSKIVLVNFNKYQDLNEHYLVIDK